MTRGDRAIEPARPRPVRATGGLLAGALAAVVLAGAVVWLAGSLPYDRLGYPDPGAVTKYGTTVVRLVVDVSAAVCAGALAFAAFFVAPRVGGLLSAHAYASVRLAHAAGWVWFSSATTMIPFVMANTAGQPVGSVLSPRAMLGLLDAQTNTKAWVWTALVALIVAMSTRFTLHWRPAALLTVVAAAGTLPPAAVGHSSSNAGHDVATNSAVVHVVAATLWLGTLIALVAHLRRGGHDLTRVTRRYRRFSLGCMIVVAASGLSDALELTGARPGGGYGLLVLVKVLVLAALIAVAVPVRRRATATARTRPVAWLLGTEAGLLLATAGVSLGLVHVPPPNITSVQVTAMDEVLGYDLGQPPTVLHLATWWRLDVLLGSLALVAAAVYLAGVWRLRRRGERWSALRTVSWLSGCAVLLVATSSGVGLYASGVLSLHMLQHMLLDMIGPLLLVLGTPVSLALRALPSAGDGPAGPREWLIAAIRSPLLRTLAHPLLTSALFIAALYGLYFTDLFATSMFQHWSHELMNVCLLVIGYLYVWSITGLDHPPREMPHLVRMGLVVVTMPFEALFGILMISSATLVAPNYFATLRLAWAPELHTDQVTAGIVAWAAGDLPMVPILALIAWQWYRQDHGDASARQAEDRAYEEMLAKLVESRRS